MEQNKCPCFSGEDYEACCAPFHQGNLPANALLLMRSRYSAYVLNLPEYIVKTTHPLNRQYTQNLFAWKRSIMQFSKTYEFQKLEILDVVEQADYARVVFTAYIAERGRDCTFTEKSYFEKLHGQWFYKAGELVPGRVPAMAANKPLRLLSLAYYGDQILRQKAEPIQEITNEIIELAHRMTETMDAMQGVGIAAPQVHRSLRMFVTRISKDRDGPQPSEAEIYINPVLSEPTEQTWKMTEGCLSVPFIRSEVERPAGITVEYMDLEGKFHKKRLSGWEAKAVLHEKDHLDGVLFIDHLPEHERRQYESQLELGRKWIHENIKE